MKRKISLTIEDEVFKSFRRYCQQNGMKISSKVELLMKDNLQTVEVTP